MLFSYIYSIQKDILKYDSIVDISRIIVFFGFFVDTEKIKRYNYFIIYFLRTI